MSDEEKDFLRENKDDLSDGDKKDYKEILDEKKETKEEEDDKGDKKVEKKPDKEEEDEETKHSFKTDEDLDAYYKERKEKEKSSCCR